MPPIPSTMDDPSNRAAILALSEKMALANTEPAKTDSKGKVIDSRPSLMSHYRAMSVKKNKKVYLKVCAGPAECKNLLCEHYARHASPSTPSTQESDAKVMMLLKLLTDKSEKDGYKVTDGYAAAMLAENENKLIPTIKAIKDDIDTREEALHQSGRLNLPKIKRALSNEIANDTSNDRPVLNYPSNCPELIPGTMARYCDIFITALEYADAEYSSVLILGRQSHLGKLVLEMKGWTKAKREEAFKFCMVEAKYRDERAKYRDVLREEKYSNMSRKKVEKAMRDWDKRHPQKTALPMVSQLFGGQGLDENDSKLFEGFPWSGEPSKSRD